MKIIPSAVLAIAALSVELFLQEPLQDSGAWVAEHLQQKDWPVLNTFADQVGVWSGYIFLVLSGAIYLVGGRHTGLLALGGSYLALAAAGTLKVLIAHPRPYWAYPDVVAFACPSDFGAPSGHASSVGACILVLWACWRRNEKQLRLKATVAVICLTIVALDRIYLGVHFYFQVMLGLSVANLATSAVMHPKVRRWLCQLQGNPRRLIPAVLCLGGMFALAAAVYFVWTPNWETSWSETISAKCGTQVDSSASLLKGMGQNAGLAFIGGCLTGYSLLSKALQAHYTLKTFALAFLLAFVVVEYAGLVAKALQSGQPGFFSIILSGMNDFASGVVLTLVLPHLFHRSVDEDKVYSRL